MDALLAQRTNESNDYVRLFGLISTRVMNHHFQMFSYNLKTYFTPLTLLAQSANAMDSLAH